MRLEALIFPVILGTAGSCASMERMAQINTSTQRIDFNAPHAQTAARIARILERQVHGESYGAHLNHLEGSFMYTD